MAVGLLNLKKQTFSILRHLGGTTIRTAVHGFGPGAATAQRGSDPELRKNRPAGAGRCARDDGSRRLLRSRLIRLRRLRLR